jgi:hypothetical protein
MVRRGSTVRVRQRALQKRRTSASPASRAQTGARLRSGTNNPSTRGRLRRFVRRSLRCGSVKQAISATLEATIGGFRRVGRGIYEIAKDAGRGVRLIDRRRAARGGCLARGSFRSLPARRRLLDGMHNLRPAIRCSPRLPAAHGTPRRTERGERRPRPPPLRSRSTTRARP